MITTSPGVCTIFRGCGCSWNWSRPIGRQCASGLSLLWSSLRCFSRSAAHGRSGRPPFMFEPMLKKVAAGGALGSDDGAPPRPVGPFCHSPDRSGLPSGIRGAGAARLGLPSAVFGTPAGRWFGHCAEARAGRAANATAASNVFMRSPLPRRHFVLLFFPASTCLSIHAMTRSASWSLFLSCMSMWLLPLMPIAGRCIISASPPAFLS